MEIILRAPAANDLIVRSPVLLTVYILRCPGFEIYSQTN